MKLNLPPLTAFRAVIGMGTALAALAGLTTNSHAGLVKPFTSGNLVVERLGDGSQALASTGNTIYFDEVTTNGVVVQSIAIPDAGGSALVDSGAAGSDGAMTLSDDGRWICFPGYNAARPYASSITGAASSAVPRAIGVLGANGIYSLAVTSSIAYSANNLRGAATDGTNNFWGSGTGTAAGIFYFGVASTSNDVYSANLRCVKAINGNLWYSTASGTPGIGIWKFSGEPTTATGNTATKILALTGSPYNFSVSPDESVIYYADDAAGISKWTKTSGTWSLAYVLNTNAVFGINVDWTTTPATVYATTGSAQANNAIIRILDNGASSVAVTNILAGASQMYRGVAFAPTNTTLVATAPSISGISPASQLLSLGSTATFTLSGYAGVPAASNRWYKISGGATNLLATQLAGSLTLSNIQASDAASYFAILTNASGSATSAVVTLTVSAAPTISAITPASISTNTGKSVVFTLSANPGTPVASNFWFKIAGGTTNLLTAQTSTNLSLTNVTSADTAQYFAILTNSFGSATSAVVSLTVTDQPPVITGIGPASLTVNAGQNAAFTVTNSGTAPFTYFWYAESATSTNFLTITTNNTLTLTNVLAANSDNYQVVVSNISMLTVTSPVVTLTVANDPLIQSQPASASGLLNGTVQFQVRAAGTALTYQWYFADTSGNLIAPVTDGTSTASGMAVVSGSTGSLLTLANIQANDLTNVVVVVTNVYGAVTSSVASLFSINATSGVLAFWDFNGQEFTNFAVNPTCVFNPQPYLGVGFAKAVGTANSPTTNFNITSSSFSPFSGAVDANNGAGFASYPAFVYPPSTQGVDHSPFFSWGTSQYPSNGIPALNKSAGVQFNVSTLGAKHIRLSYDSRVSATASDYERVQFTTNGTDWVDYPASANFNNVGSTYFQFTNDFTGFPGVDNNTNFAVRIVTEYQNTATYGISANTNFIGTANTYGTGGTVTYDVVTFYADAITNNNAAPVLTWINNTNMEDNASLTLKFTATDDTTPADQITYSAVSLNASKLNPNFAFGGTGTNRTLTVSFGTGLSDPVGAAPILITATDTNGDSTASWFLLTVSSVNLPPTNSLTALKATNLLANTALTIPFKVSDDHTAPANLTYAVSSDNSTLIPAENITVDSTDPANPKLALGIITNQVGVATINVTVNDNDTTEPRSTTASFALVVKPNTNILAIDYFNYDNSAALDSKSNFWQHLSGVVGQLKYNSGVALVDSVNNTENLQTPLIGAPYRTNSGVTLYASLQLNMADATQLPTGNGTYIAMFNDGSGNTANVEGCLVVATNGAASGFYRVGIATGVSANATNAQTQMFPQDLSPNSNYVIVISLSLTNGYSQLWVNPTSPAAASVISTTLPSAQTNLYSISDFELRESGQPSGGLASVSHLLVGTSFASVFYPPVANPDTIGLTENSGATTISPLVNDSGWSLTLVTASETDGYGTAAISGTNIVYTPAANFIGTATINYTLQDNLGETNSSVITVVVTNIPPVARPVAYAVSENSVNNALNPLTNCAVSTPGGTLGLVSASETDGNGSVSISGNQLLFTPTGNFTGTATIAYTITDNIGGTNSSTITVNVANLTPIPVVAQFANGQLVLSWTNPAFSLQFSTNVAGPYVVIPNAASPYTNLITTNATGFYRLVH